MSVDPTREQFKAFMQLPRQGPIFMINLIRLRPKAQYPQGHSHADKGLTGAEAYRLYGKSSAPVFSEVGGQQVWLGKPEALLIGPENESWDLAFIASYPNPKAFAAMIQNAEYKKCVVHRQAAVQDSRLIRCENLKPGAFFGHSKL